MTKAREGPHIEPYNATVDLLERNLVRDRKDRPYLIAGGRTWSYEEVADAADAAGRGLLDLGLQPGDRLLISLRDRPEFVISFWGAMKAGLVPVPIHQGLSAPDLHFILSDSDAKVIVCDRASAGAALEATAGNGVHAVLVEMPARRGTIAWADLCGGTGRLPAAVTTEEDVALWLYTSGTTGMPKAVVHRHGHLKAAPQALCRQVVQMQPDDVVLSVSKAFFAYGLGNSVYLPASVGASVVLNEGPSVPPRVQAVLNRSRPTVLFGVPAFFRGFLELPDAHVPPSVRMILSAGEALSAGLLHRFDERFGLMLLDGLGSTEALHHVSSNRPDDVEAGSAGRPLDGYQAEVLDREQQPVAEGTSGELWIRGPTVFAGYWRRPDLTARAFRDSWMRTGDVVRMVDGRIFYQGRTDDLMKLGGVWVAPTEIEAVLQSHPSVADAAVTIVDDPSGVSVLKAFVVVGSPVGTLIEELRRSCRRRLATFKVPQEFEIVEQLPRTVTGKLKRFALRAGS